MLDLFLIGRTIALRIVTVEVAIIGTDYVGLTAWSIDSGRIAMTLRRHLLRRTKVWNRNWCPRLLVAFRTLTALPYQSRKRPWQQL